MASRLSLIPLVGALATTLRRAVAIVLPLALLAPLPGHAATPSMSDPKAATANTEAPDAERFFQSIVKVRARAVPNARSSATLGRSARAPGWSSATTV